MTDWISVEDRLPDVPENTHVWVVGLDINDDPHDPFIVGYVGGWPLSENFELLHVTHWYPLPDKCPCKDIV